MRRGVLLQERGFALIMALIVLGAGSVILVPVLRYASTALNSMRINNEIVRKQYAYDAMSQLAAWELQYDTVFDCKGVVKPFVDCVADEGLWWITTDNILGETKQMVVSRVNDVQTKIKVEVPSIPPLSPLLTPTPTSGACLYVSIFHDKSWVGINKPVVYTLALLNCSNQFNTRIRRIKVLLPSTFSYVPASTQTNYSPQPGDLIPEEGIQYYPYPSNVVMLNWPDGDNSYTGGNTIQLAVGQTITWTFSAIPSKAGVFFVDSVVCHFSSKSGDPGPCETSFTSGKVSPLVVGMFNVKGGGRKWSMTVDKQALILSESRE